MYLWKYWRESRIAWIVATLVVVLLTGAYFWGQAHMSVESNRGIETPQAYAGVLYALLFATSAPLALFAWAMGSFGTGRNLGEGAGAFLLTRPKRRSWFVWRDWLSGMAIVTFFVLLAHLLEGEEIYRNLVRGGAPAKIVFHHGTDYLSLVAAMSLNTVSSLLLCGLVFGVVYLLTVVLKSALGIVAGGGAIAGYVIFSAILQHYTGYHLPALLQTVFAQFPHGEGVAGVTPGLGLSLAVRAGVLLLFPFAAQLVLERSDI